MTMSVTLAEYQTISATQFRDEVERSGRPAVFRGLIKDWPVVRAARNSNQALADYLRRFDRGRQVGAMLGPPRIKGRFAYNETLSAFNFKRQTVKLSGALDFLLSAADEENPPAFAVQSAQVWQNLPGFEAENPLPLLAPDVEPRIWIGNRVTVAAHHDPSENIACVVAGKRRFTLLPPEQIGNLYMGPFERTPAGTTISLVDFDAPDLERFPGFAEAMEAAIEVDLEPGDAVYIPYMWWHHVRSLAPINMLVNYWWKAKPRTQDHPMDALLHAMLTIRDLPETYRQAWKAHFDHYVFETNGPAGAHIPDPQKGVLGELDEEKLKALRDAVQNGLNRR
jgi:hypothetical protein